MDGHNWMYPLAYGFMDSETEDNWKWWMAQLHKVVGDLPKLAICSDACKGLLNAVRDVFPEVRYKEKNDPRAMLMLKLLGLMPLYPAE